MVLFVSLLQQNMVYSVYEQAAEPLVRVVYTNPVAKMRVPPLPYPCLPDQIPFQA